MAVAAIVRRVLSVLLFASEGRFCGGALQAREVGDDCHCRDSSHPVCGRFLQLEYVR